MHWFFCIKQFILTCNVIDLEIIFLLTDFKLYCDPKLMISMFAEPANTTVTSVYVELNIQQITFFSNDVYYVGETKTCTKIETFSDNSPENA